MFFILKGEGVLKMQKNKKNLEYIWIRITHYRNIKTKDNSIYILKVHLQVILDFLE